MSRTNSQIDEPVAISVDKFCRALGISIQSGYNAIRRGEVHAARIGGRLVVPRSEIGRILRVPQTRDEGSSPDAAA